MSEKQKRHLLVPTSENFGEDHTDWLSRLSPQESLERIFYLERILLKVEETYGTDFVRSAALDVVAHIARTRRP